MMSEIIRNPLVSIIIPVYNGSNYLREAIDSALNQTYQNKEILVVNDGSADEGRTEKIAMSYGKAIIYIKKENGGVSSALNLGIKNMRGEYFSWLSHDDKYAPDKIEKQVELLKNYQDKNLIALCGSTQIDKESRPLGNINRVDRFKNGIHSWDKCLMSLFEKGTINGCALLIPKGVFEKCGFFNESFRFNQDLDMWIRFFLNQYSMVYSTDIGAYTRVHDEQVTQTKHELFHQDCEDMSQYLIPQLLRISSKKENFLYAYAKNNAKYKNISVVKKAIQKGKKQRLFSGWMVLSLKVFMKYGEIRPKIRKVYYRIFKRVKTQ